MPYHLELGSGGHSFGGKAIVVNSKTGAHMTRTPENMGKATERLEKAEKKGEDVVWNKALRMSEKAYNKEQWHAKRAKKAPASQKRESEAEAEARRKLSTDRLREWATKIHQKGEEAREAHRTKEGEAITYKALNALWNGSPTSHNSITYKSVSAITDEEMKSAINKAYVGGTDIHFDFTREGGSVVITPHARSHQSERSFQTQFNKKAWKEHNVSPEGYQYTSAEIEMFHPGRGFK